MRLPYYQVDAFADRVFRGNPAGVCLLSGWLPDSLLQAIAAENNLSETAFVAMDREPAHIRWFTPTAEVPLCGHATLAAGAVLLGILDPQCPRVEFHSRSGVLAVGRVGDRYHVDLPRLELEPCAPPAVLADALGLPTGDVWVCRADPNYYVILNSENEVAALRPDLSLLTRLHPCGVAVSAPGHSADFVSRYFAPGYGIPEDPVTGSIHCGLGPLWGDRLNRSSLVAVQLSPRGGRLELEVGDETVRLWGEAVTYLSGQIVVPDAEAEEL